MNVYYSTLRPVSIGTYPKDGMVDFENFDKRRYVKEIDHEAWGILHYDRKLTEEECRSYDLVAPTEKPEPFKMSKPLLMECIETYGERAQTDMAIEEMSELTKALLKERRIELLPKEERMRHEIYERAVEDITEEMADVIIMLSQLTLIFENREAIQEQITYKQERQRERLKYLKDSEF